jgi:hypothetical protein
MRIGVMDDPQGYYIHEEYIIGLHLNMDNFKIESNGRRDKKGHATMRSLHREAQSYRDDNKRIMKT